jgi:perosamine synthetase
MSSDPAFIPLSVPSLEGREKAYLEACVADNWVSSVGPFVTAFEAEFARQVGAGHAVACASGTAALHLALLAAGVGPGDLVLVSTLTFIASVNAVRYVGADPVLVDAHPGDAQMDLDLVEDFLERECLTRDGVCRHRASGRRVAAVLPVHILGHGVDLPRLLEVADRHHLALVEDAAEALGVRVAGRAAGTFGRLGCFSFNGNKTITTGAGGMVVTDESALAVRVRHLSEQAKRPGGEYVHDEIGYNYRMSNLHAAVGLAQMERLPDHLTRKRAIAARYAEAFTGLPGLGWIGPGSTVEGAWWLFTITLDPDVAGVTARELRTALEKLKIDSRPLWQPIHLSPAHAGGLRLGGAVAERFHDRALSLPSSVGLSPDDQDRVVAGVLASLRRGREGKENA